MAIANAEFYSMAIFEIDQWLRSGCDYTKGVQLYQKFGDNGTVKKMLAQGSSAYNIATLKERLTKLNVQAIDKRAPHVEKVEEIRQDPELEKLKESWRPSYRMMAEFHSQMKRSTSVERRRLLALDILDREQECRIIWKKIDNWGKPEADVQLPPDEDMNPVELMKALGNARSNLSKAKKKGDPDKIKKLETLISELQDKIENI